MVSLGPGDPPHAAFPKPQALAELLAQTGASSDYGAGFGSFARPEAEPG